MSGMHRHNNILRQLDREFNSHFNSTFISKYAFLCDAEDPVDLHGDDGVKNGFITYMTAWLSNIDRLMSMALACSEVIDFSGYDLIDLGGGKSVSTIYLSHNYKFKSITSVDIHPMLLEDGKKNLDKYCKIEEKILHINFVCQDIRKYLIEKGKYIFFAFNPFEWQVFERFIRNNLEVLKDSGSVILYANDRCINELLDFSTLLARDDYYNLSVVKF